MVSIAVPIRGDFEKTNILNIFILALSHLVTYVVNQYRGGPRLSSLDVGLD